MSLRVFRFLTLKNELASRMSLTRKYCRHLTNNLKFDYCPLQLRTKFNLREVCCNVKQSYLSEKCFASNNQTEIEFELACNETLESLCEYFEQIVEESPELDNPDITFSDGVLTVQLGDSYGTYVINRQTPNKQIWLSSPTSGPKRYDFNGAKWVYKHDGVCLHELLNTELSKIVLVDVDFSKCIFGGA